MEHGFEGGLERNKSRIEILFTQRSRQNLWIDFKWQEESGGTTRHDRYKRLIRNIFSKVRKGLFPLLRLYEIGPVEPEANFSDACLSKTSKIEPIFSSCPCFSITVSHTQCE